MVEIVEVATCSKGGAAEVIGGNGPEVVALELEAGAKNIKAITEVKSKWRERRFLMRE